MNGWGTATLTKRCVSETIENETLFSRTEVAGRFPHLLLVCSECCSGVLKPKKYRLYLYSSVSVFCQVTKNCSGTVKKDTDGWMDRGGASVPLRTPPPGGGPAPHVYRSGRSQWNCLAKGKFSVNFLFAIAMPCVELAIRMTVFGFDGMSGPWR